MPDTVAQALNKASQILAETSETPRLDAELLLAYALGIERSALLLRQRDLLPPPDFAELIARRAKHEPVAYITGTQHFWNLRLAVTPDVLIPRADSECLIESALEYFVGRTKPTSILDLGTGSGALLLAALSEFAEATGTAMDASAGALAVAKANAAASGFSPRAQFRHLSWHAQNWIAQLGQRYDLILCNPPYVETGAALAPTVRDYEPASALYAESDGLAEYRHLIPHIPQMLAPGGIAIFEIGMGQEKTVTDLAAFAGLNAAARKDLGGIVRAILLTAQSGG